MACRSRLIPTVCVAIASILGGTAASCSRGQKEAPAAQATPKSDLTLLVTTDLQGTVEPCGCTSDPHGGLDRTAEIVREARKEGGERVLFLDGGSLLFSKLEIPEELEAQEELTAAFLVETMERRLRPAAIGLGPYDLARGPAEVRPPRHAVNLSEEAGVPLAPPAVVKAGAHKVGIFGVVSPRALGPAGIEATDPAGAAAKAIADLRKRGARVIVGLAHMTRPEAVELARAAGGIDLLIVGQTVKASQLVIRHDPVKVGDTWLIEPADRGQVVSRIDLTFRGDGALSDAIGEARAEVAAAALDEKIAALEARLVGWESADDADPAFVAQKKKELAELEQERKELAKAPLLVPDKGSYFTLTQIPVRKRLPCNEQVLAAKTALDKAIGEKNLEVFAEIEPPGAAEGEATYVGIEECEMCHPEQTDFWKTTPHHQAWATLEKYGKQFDLGCVYCHVTGFDRPGGTNLAHLDGFRNVQCEECHGPGSLHAETGDIELILKTPTEETCVGCHNEEHSDTFELEAYLRSVTGEGHGEEMRDRLGDGPTGADLRKAALEKAGAELGENCLK